MLLRHSAPAVLVRQFDAHGFDLAKQGAGMNPQFLRRGRPIAVMAMDRIHDMDGLQRFHRQTARDRFGMVCVLIAEFRREMR